MKPSRRLFLVLCGLLVAVTGAGSPLRAAEPVRVLIVTGQNNHDWETDSKSLKATFLKTGRFEVDTTVTPPEKPRVKKAKGKAKPAPAPELDPEAEKQRAEAWKNWRPKFSDYDVIVNDYNGEAWPAEVEKAFVDYIRGGGGLVNVHAANNAFPNWPEFNQMTGLLWRPALFGDRITIDDATGKQIRMKRGEGPGAGHGEKHDYVVKVRNAAHPIMAGLPGEWLHAHDELYHGQRGPARDMQILSSAYSDPKRGGTGAHEPITWVIPFGDGTCVTTLLGHKGRSDTEVLDALHCVGFQTVVARAAEFAATGKVTLPVPKKFPNKVQRFVQDPGLE